MLAWTQSYLALINSAFAVQVVRVFRGELAAVSITLSNVADSRTKSQKTKCQKTKSQMQKVKMDKSQMEKSQMDKSQNG